MRTVKAALPSPQVKDFDGARVGSEVVVDVNNEVYFEVDFKEDVYSLVDLEVVSGVDFKEELHLVLDFSVVFGVGTKVEVHFVVVVCG